MRTESRALVEWRALQLERAKALEPYRRAATVVIGVIGLGLAAGLGTAGGRYALRRASEIWPDAGIFPITKARAKDGVACVDPNQAIAATTIVTTPDLADRMVVIPVVSPGMEAD